MSMKIKSEVKSIILPMNSKVEGINLELEFDTVEEFKEYKEQERKSNEVMVDNIKELFDSLSILDSLLKETLNTTESNIKLTPALAPTEAPERRESSVPAGLRLVPSEEEDLADEDTEEYDDENWESIFEDDDYDEDEAEYCEPEPIVRSVPEGFRLANREEAEEMPSYARIRLTPASPTNTETNSPFIVDEENEVPGQIMFRELFKDEEIKEDYDI